MARYRMTPRSTGERRWRLSVTNVDQADSLYLLLAEVLDVPASTLTEDSSPNDIPTWDSVASMTLMLMLEETFGITFVAEEIAMLTSVRATRKILRDKGAAV
jgi:acyl carrier protein